MEKRPICGLYPTEFITNVVIESGVTSIGVHAFDNCTKLTSVTIPGAVTSIGNSAFQSCSALTSIVIFEGVEKIGSAFKGCTALTTANISKSIKNTEETSESGSPIVVYGICASAFSDASNLKTMEQAEDGYYYLRKNS